MVASEVDCAISETVKKTINRAGSARKPISISRREPSEPNEVPTSMPARAMKTRASANRPTRAMASAAGEKISSADTPYNTYTRGGLPPTPIAMPGLASLNAAVRPQPTKALYFVARGDGSSVFSDNLADHNRAVNTYQRGAR